MKHSKTQAHATAKKRRRLLVVEDAICVQRCMLNILHHLGAEVDIASNGQLACDMAEESKAQGRPYELILMDMQMPQMNGYQATKWLRENGWKQCPIIALTAYDTETHYQKMLEAGCNGYATKPANETVLRDILAQYLTDDENAKS